MKVKTKRGLLAATLIMSIMGLVLPFASLSDKAVSAYAEPEESSEVLSSEEQSSEEDVSSEESAQSSEMANSELNSESANEEQKFKWAIKEVSISYRDDSESAYAKCYENPERIGSYFLSADGWNDEDEFDIVLNAKGALATKLEGKVMYIYEYKPTVVNFNGEAIAQNQDKTFTLHKPVEAGEYTLYIGFTKTLVVNPMELTNLDWSSLLTVPNLMTILSWAVIVVFFLVFFFLSRKYKKEGSTSLQTIRKELLKYVDDNFGKEVSAVVADAFDKLLKKTFVAIDSKLDKMSSNESIMIRCLLLMQENTPEARLAITECLSKLDMAEDNKSAEVKALIEAEIQKYKEEQEAKEQALAKAKELNESWAEKVEEKPSADEDEGDGGDADGGYGSL